MIELGLARPLLAASVPNIIRTIEATIDEKGTVHLLEPITVARSRRAFVIILDEDPSSKISEGPHLSEAALGTDWNRPEEDAAWSSLQQP